MAKTWKFVVRTAVGGSAKGHFFTNTLHVQTDALLDSVDMQTIAQSVAGTLRAGLLSICTIVSVTISDPARAGMGYDPMNVRTVGIGLAGQKDIGANAPEIKEVVARFKASGTTGRGGGINLRMCLFDAEVTGVGDGEPSAVGNTAAMADVAVGLNNLNAAPNSLRIWSKGKTGVVSDRPVTNVAYAGVAHRDAHIRRRGKRASTKAPAWTKEAENALHTLLDLVGTYQIAKAGSAALAAPEVSAAIGALGEAAGGLLPALALL